MRALLVLVPSRGRPHNIAELASCWEFTESGYAQLLVAVDDDDPCLPEYQRVLDSLKWECPPILVVGPRLRIGGTLNSLATQFSEYYFALGFMGDDHRPRSHGWDLRFVEELKDLGTGIVYGDDLLQGESLATAFALTSDIVRTVGYLVPGGIVHMYFDNALMDIGRGIGKIRYLSDVVLEHMHPGAGKASWDSSYLDTNSAQQYIEDGSRYTVWKESSLEADLHKLRKLV
jgi:hypothetical protein